MEGKDNYLEEELRTKNKEQRCKKLEVGDRGPEIEGEHISRFWQDLKPDESREGERVRLNPVCHQAGALRQSILCDFAPLWFNLSLNP
jgi:hypothetical protein